jgi:release factor glutamine methyltransferase
LRSLAKKPPDLALNLLSISGALKEACTAIDRGDARVLLCHVLRCESAYLAAHPEALLTPRQAADLAALVARRAAGEPVAYLMGEREFFGHRCKVSPAVLIPRPETEGLVERALEHIPAGQPSTVLDLGTGSGCIAISIALARPQAQVHAVDRSPEALNVARENAARLGAENVRFAMSDWFSSLAGESYDVIVSNPPYVAADDPHLNEGDLRWEPALALTAGGDGLDAIRHIAARAPLHLCAKGWLFLEHGFDQAPKVRRVLQGAGFADVASTTDLSGIERVTGGRLTPHISGQ